ncbi:MAG TPA: His/Gly/Thr/Pro-type tRNA ligase C-terminal domain-containing protein, partial [Ferruginibacter sp.]|nr:His/Gly/Thr/Pro-type tRNA ligase C-terminal domain-containing protein [Ferruginibacter sp.]
KFMEYAQQVTQKLRLNMIRAEVDDRSEKIGKKIRDAEMLKIPYMLIIGEKEMQENSVSVRRQGHGDTGMVQVDNLINSLLQDIRDRKNDTIPAQGS